MSACAPVEEQSPASVRSAETVATAGISAPIPTDPPAAAPVAAISTRGVISGIHFDGVAFDSRTHRLRVVDQPGGPAAQYPDARAAGRSIGGIAAINAGFFTPSGEPLGLVVSSGKASGAWNSASSLGSGAWHEDINGRSAITRREVLGRGAAAAMPELLQAGPMLVDKGRAVAGLESEKSSARSVILWDGGTRWWVGRSSPCPLAKLSTILAGASPSGWPVRFALNLDGGRSSDLWISAAVPGGPVELRPVWNRPVRNFLVLTPR